MKIFRHSEKWEKFYSQNSYIHCPDFTINILLFIPYLFIYPSIQPLIHLTFKYISM